MFCLQFADQFVDLVRLLPNLRQFFGFGMTRGGGEVACSLPLPPAVCGDGAADSCVAGGCAGNRPIKTPAATQATAIFKIRIIIRFVPLLCFFATGTVAKRVPAVDDFTDRVFFARYSPASVRVGRRLTHYIVARPNTIDQRRNRLPADDPGRKETHEGLLYPMQGRKSGCCAGDHRSCGETRLCC